MQALLLAAGRSQRFWPLGDKNFLQLHDRTLIEEQVETLKRAGIKEFVVVGGKHNLAKLQKLFPKSTVVEQKKPAQGMRGAVLAAEKFLTGPVLIVSTNDIFEAAAVKKVLATKNADGAILSQTVKNYFPGGYLKLDGDRVRRIIEKPEPELIPSNQINLVCHLINNPTSLIKVLKKTHSHKDDAYEQALNTLFEKQNFVAVPNPGAWQAIKYPWHLLDLIQTRLSKVKRAISPKAQIAKSATISGPVVVEAGVKIFDYAVIQGPAVLRKNSVVGTHSLVRESIVAENAVVGSGSELARSFLGASSWLHRNYAGDSIIAENVSLGSGAVCANLRLDEGEVKSVVQKIKTGTQRNKFGCVVGSGCRIGVNTSIMPGVLIGKNSFVGSGLIVDKNIPDGSFVVGSTQNKIMKNKKILTPRKSLIK